MASIPGIPLLSGPPSTIDSSDACRKCNKEFNILFARSRKCNHCGYLYCHACSDFQALMPRTGSESGYDPVHVCGYCIELLKITAAAVNQLKASPLSKLISYADSYDINISRAVEKDDIIETLIRVRRPDGCLPTAKENFYRSYKVPNPFAGVRPRSFFSRGADGPPSVAPRPQAQPASDPYRYSAATDNAPPRFTATSHNYHQAHDSNSGASPYYDYHYYPYGAYRSNRPPQSQPSSTYHPSPSASSAQQPRLYRPQELWSSPRFNTSSEHRPLPRTHPNFTSSTPHQRQRTTSTFTQPQTSSSPPIPTLDQLLIMTQSSINALSVGVLKSILFTNHVNATMILEKSELVSKVMALVDDEKRERERQRLVERLEEDRRRAEREESTSREQEHRRRREEEEWSRTERRESHRTRLDEVEDGTDNMDIDIEVVDEDEDQATPPHMSGRHADYGEQTEATISATPSETSAIPEKPASFLERSGLCVICQDEEANIAIVDCGHLAMCRGCSELVMASSKECPLCRTRIVTEARLLRIFKS